jgi:hypothetical protein
MYRLDVGLAFVKRMCGCISQKHIAPACPEDCVHGWPPFPVSLSPALQHAIAARLDGCAVVKVQ